ncbi:ATPase [Bacillus sp. FJAT-22090]|uniref:ATPase n=1 Tax=Bacillus sp. FJAT-22090 TaxID=1581038 RepID=UPI0011A95BCF|nr:ATPase [Bacillus sp. FJAT-22090]
MSGFLGNAMIIIPIIAGGLTSLILSKTFKEKEKVDKGFEFIYFKLTYRRKMIRSLTSLPIVIIALLIIYYYSNWSLEFYITFVLLVLLIGLAQFIYNFKKWKEVVEQ